MHKSEFIFITELFVSIISFLIDDHAVSLQLKLIQNSYKLLYSDCQIDVEQENTISRLHGQ